MRNIYKPVHFPPVHPLKLKLWEEQNSFPFVHAPMPCRLHSKILAKMDPSLRIFRENSILKMSQHFEKTNSFIFDCIFQLWQHDLFTGLGKLISFTCRLNVDISFKKLFRISATCESTFKWISHSQHIRLAICSAILPSRRRGFPIFKNRNTSLDLWPLF